MPAAEAPNDEPAEEAEEAEAEAEAGAGGWYPESPVLTPRLQVCKQDLLLGSKV